MTQVDFPSTWKKYTLDLCNSCSAGCCTMPVEVKLEDLVRLQLVTEDEAQGSLKKLSRRLLKAGIISSYRAGTELFMLTQKSNSDCLFLDTQTRLCTVYDRRPEVCREFPSVGPRPGSCPYQRRS